MSYSTPGAAFSPATFGHIVIDLYPVDGPSSPIVRIEGIDIATGAVAWSYKPIGMTYDFPVQCGGTLTMCVTWEAGLASSSLLEMNAATGRVIRTIPNIERVLGQNLYQTMSSTPQLMQIGSHGQPLWTKSTASIFGASYDDPDYGWNISPFDALNVGALGKKLKGQTYDLSGQTSTGFTIASGKPMWTDPGAYDCMGTLAFLSSPVLCVFNGSFTYTGSGGVPNLSGVSLSLDGVTPRTGAVTWTQPSVQDVTGFMAGTPLAFRGSDEVVIKQKGHYLLLNAKSGKTTLVASGDTFWCATIPQIKVVAPAGSTYGSVRAGSDEFAGCHANGVSVSALPKDQPSFVGVKLDGKFFWASSHGLRAELVT